MSRKLSSCWHKAQRWTTNCFLCTPTDILAIEACIPPLELLHRYKRRLANLRVLCSPSEINVAAARLPRSEPTPSLHWHSPYHRLLLRGNSGHRNPLSWLTPRPPAKNRTHLPLDALPHSMLFILGPDGDKPLPVTSLYLLCQPYPNTRPGRWYPELRLLCRNLLLRQWEQAAPDSAEYPYRPSPSPHLVMGLNRFTAGHLPQMRSGKRYVRVHPSGDSDVPTTCPRCDLAPETFQHAIHRCPAKELARSRHLQGVTDIGLNAPALSLASLLGPLVPFISLTARPFPLAMFLRRSSSSQSVSSLSANLVSFAYFMSSQES